MADPFLSGLLNYYNINSKNSRREIFVATAPSALPRVVLIALKSGCSTISSIAATLIFDDHVDC
ncbi:MAG: hypothetical protein AB9883_01195 [Acidaminococcaceae bacterium]